MEKVGLKKDYDFISFGWRKNFDNASDFLSVFLSHRSTNGYKSEKYDHLYNKLLNSNTTEERQLINKQLNDIIIEENIVIPIYTSIGRSLSNPKLKGLYFNDKPNRIKNFYFIK